MLMLAIEKAGFKPKDDVALALDVAASELYEDNKYKLEGGIFGAEEMVAFYESLINDYPIVSIEDGFSQNDWEGWASSRPGAGKDQIVGDDIYVTNPKILMEGIKKSVANSVLIKLNQIGTVTKTLTTIEIQKGQDIRASSPTDRARQRLLLSQIWRLPPTPAG